MIRKLVMIVAIITFCASGLAYAGAKKVDKIDETHSFARAGADNRLVVDNVWGDIEVTGYDGDEIRVKAVKTIRASSEDEIPEIEREVTLEIIKEDDLLELYVDGPFRCRDGEERRRHRRWRRDYEVRFDFEIQVPRETFVELDTVNDSEILVKNVDGDYQIHNVNGGIEMRSIAGSGEVYAVNGDVTVDFAENPSGNSRYGSLNGELRLHFLPGLSADFYLKTFNGEVFSDFPVSYLPLKSAAHTDNKKGRHVYKVSRQTAVRAGNGGPEIVLDGFNGDMFILKKG